MADTAGTTSGGDHGHKEEQVSMQLPTAAVEMEDLSNSRDISEAQKPSETPASIPVPAKDDAAAADSTPGQETSATAAESSSKTADKAPAAAGEEQDSLTIDPVDPQPDASADSQLAVEIMLLLPTGARHPFRIDEKYLTKRNVTITGMTEGGEPDPFSITVYTLKELILRDWRKEWEQPPREPTSIRLIHFGKLLEDRQPLNHYQFSNHIRNVVHMTVKPQDIIDEEEAAKKVKESGRDSGRSGCCVIL